MTVRIVSATPAFHRSPNHLHTPALAPVARFFRETPLWVTSRAGRQPMAGRVASPFISRARAVARKRARLIVGCAFAALTLAGSMLLARHLTRTSWPLQRAHMGLVALAGGLYFASFILRALGWQKLFPASTRPDRSRCLAACGAAAASGAVLPFRLDYLVKIATLRRLAGVTLGLEVIAFSILSLGLVDSVAMFPLAIGAIVTSGAIFRAPLVVVLLFCLGCICVLTLGPRIARLPLIARSSRMQAACRRL